MGSPQRRVVIKDAKTTKRLGDLRDLGGAESIRSSAPLVYGFQIFIPSPLKMRRFLRFFAPHP